MTAPELAARTGATPTQIEELVASGIVTPTADGAFAVADINRVRIAQALASEGYASPMSRGSSRAAPCRSTRSNT